MTSPAATRALGLRAGEWVQVRSAEEILATLDADSSLDALPFMPEMLQYCGGQFRVYKVAHKSCDTLVNWTVARGMDDAVHLEDLRCDGSGHDGCQAGCLIYWKEAWLERTAPPEPGAAPAPPPRLAAVPELVTITRATRRPDAEAAAGEPVYSCQATQHYVATRSLHWWDPRHYVRALTSGNVDFGTWLRTLALAAYNNVMRKIPGGRVRPYVRGLAGDETPSLRLNIQAGELVRVRPKDEIMPTINAKRKNRGMSFDEEMVPFCGNTYRVHRRVDHIINEHTGKMMRFSNPCLILDGVSCGGCLSRYRLFCPRSIYPYWREIWVERAEDARAPAANAGD